MFSRAGYKVSENTKTKSRKIRIYPTQLQKILLSKFFGIQRLSYNKAIEFLKKPDTVANWKSIKTEIIQSLPEFSNEVPYQVRSIAIKDACTAVSLAKRKCLKYKQFQNVRFRSKKDLRQNFVVPTNAINTKKGEIYTRTLGRVRFSEPLPEIKYDCRLIKSGNEYYICIPVDKVTKIPDNQRKEVVALDPGVRTFITFFSPEMIGKIGSKDISRIYRLCYTLDDIQSRMSKSLCKKKRKLRLISDKIRKKIRNLIDECHHKVARFLCLNYKTILLPEFNTIDMVSKLSSKTARAMFTWSHYRFKMFLSHKCEELSSELLIVNESYTSKTCSICGEINNIGSREKYRCRRCGISHDRDINGARGMFLKAMRDHSLADNVLPCNC